MYSIIIAFIGLITSASSDSSNLLCDEDVLWADSDGLWEHDYNNCKIKYPGMTDYNQGSATSFIEIDPSLFQTPTNYPLIFTMKGKVSQNQYFKDDAYFGVDIRKQSGMRYIAKLNLQNFGIYGGWTSSASNITAGNKKTSRSGFNTYADGSPIDLSFDKYYTVKIKVSSRDASAYKFYINDKLVSSCDYRGDKTFITELGVYSAVAPYVGDEVEVTFNEVSYLYAKDASKKKIKIKRKKKKKKKKKRKKRKKQMIFGVVLVLLILNVICCLYYYCFQDKKANYVRVKISDSCIDETEDEGLNV